MHLLMTNKNYVHVRAKLILFTLSSFSQINETEQEKAKREKDKQEMTLIGTKTLLKCCHNRMNSFNELLLNSAKPKVIILI